MSAWEITNTVALLLMPPGSVLVLGAAGLLLMRRRRAAGLVLVALSWAALYVLSMPYIAAMLLRSIEPQPANPLARPADAIVVLGGGKNYAAPEYGGKDRVHPQLLARLRYGAYLQRATGKPLLVTGGSPRGDAVPEGQVMKQVLEREFNVPVRWVEDASRTTQENAALSYAIAHPQGVQTVYLVTHAWHMKRAQLSFEHAGFRVIAAPTLYKTEGPRRVIDFLPDADALNSSSIFIHEVLGLAWYRLKFAISSRS